MRIVLGLNAGKKALCENRGINFEVPEVLLERTNEIFGTSLSVYETVELIVNQVRTRKDEAIKELSEKLDGTTFDSLEISCSDVSNAYEQVSTEVVEALKLAEARIRKFHENTVPKSWHDSNEGYGQLINPVGRVGAYVPGGPAAYPSTVLMTTVPAKVSGVNEVFICTPPTTNGAPNPIVLVAADIAGVDRIFTIGGAQAIAAMAYGTESVPKADVICGPGNVFVTLAKKIVFGDVGIDGLYGPTETVIIADEFANPTLCAVDLLAQAEHDQLAAPVLITTSKDFASQVSDELYLRLERLDRKIIALEAIKNRGMIVVVNDLEEAFDLSNEFAPEHVSLAVKNPYDKAKYIKNAGAIFLGEFSHEVIGDYVAGPSHVMPTGGTARFSSGINVNSFLKISPLVGVGKDVARKLSSAASVIARAEGLTAHAEAAEVRDEILGE